MRTFWNKQSARVAARLVDTFPARLLRKRRAAAKGLL
jgi:hypothetical protein